MENEGILRVRWRWEGRSSKMESRGVILGRVRRWEVIVLQRNERKRQ